MPAFGLSIPNGITMEIRPPWILRKRFFDRQGRQVGVMNAMMVVLRSNVNLLIAKDDYALRTCGNLERRLIFITTEPKAWHAHLYGLSASHFFCPISVFLAFLHLS